MGITGVTIGDGAEHFDCLGGGKHALGWIVAIAKHASSHHSPSFRNPLLYL